MKLLTWSLRHLIKTLAVPVQVFILSNADLGKAIDKTVFPGMQGGPLMHVIAGKAVCFEEAAATCSSKSMVNRLLTTPKSSLRH
ncbi:MAG: hypothetical protein R3C11_28940 [Planctomycetaceae bacterium]